MASILDDYQPEEDFCRENENISRRTCARYRNKPDGLPYIMWGGKVYIHVEGARAWRLRRTVRRNPTRESQRNQTRSRRVA